MESCWDRWARKGTESRKLEEKHRRQGKRFWYKNIDHLENICDCHDCRKRKKRELKHLWPRAELQEQARAKDSEE